MPPLEDYFSKSLLISQWPRLSEPIRLMIPFSLRDFIRNDTAFRLIRRCKVKPSRLHFRETVQRSYISDVPCPELKNPCHQ